MLNLLSNRVKVFLGIVLFLFAGSALVPFRGVSNLDALHLSWPAGTATPVLRVDLEAGTGKIVEFLDAGTPVWSVSDGGGVTRTGGETLADSWAIEGGTALATGTPALRVDNDGVSELLAIQDTGVDAFNIYNGGGVVVAAPTAIATGVPAFKVNNLGVSELLAIQDTGVDAFNIYNGGGVVVAAPTAIATGVPAFKVNNLGVSELLAIQDGGTDAFNIYNGGGVVVAAPTAIATAQPAFRVNNPGVSVSLDVQSDGTTIAQFEDGGTLDLIANPIEQDLGTENLGVLPSVCTVSITYTAAAGGSGTVCTIGASEKWFVHYVYANITTDFDATGDDAFVDIGDGSDVDGLLDLDDAELQAADTEGTGAPAGWQGFMSTDARGAYMANGHGFIYDGSETIDYAIDETSGETLSAGALTIYVVYTRIQ